MPGVSKCLTRAGPPGKLYLVLLNPQHVKALPGHKTDRVDAARIAELLQYGLVRASFVPPAEIRELRDLVRRRVHLQQDRSRVSSRIHRLLELHNVKLSSVLMAWSHSPNACSIFSTIGKRRPSPSSGNSRATTWPPCSRSAPPPTASPPEFTREIR